MNEPQPTNIISDALAVTSTLKTDGQIRDYLETVVNNQRFAIRSRRPELTEGTLVSGSGCNIICPELAQTLDRDPNVDEVTYVILGPEGGIQNATGYSHHLMIVRLKGNQRKYLLDPTYIQFLPKKDREEYAMGTLKIPSVMVIELNGRKNLFEDLALHRIPKTWQNDTYSYLDLR